MCFAPRKQKFFASVSQDNTLKVWSVLESAEDDGEEIQVSSANMTIMAH